jgi:hypothetical protein
MLVAMPGLEAVRKAVWARLAGLLPATQRLSGVRAAKSAVPSTSSSLKRVDRATRTRCSYGPSKLQLLHRDNVLA